MVADAIHLQTLGRHPELVQIAHGTDHEIGMGSGQIDEADPRYFEDGMSSLNRDVRPADVGADENVQMSGFGSYLRKDHCITPGQTRTDISGFRVRGTAFIPQERVASSRIRLKTASAPAATSTPEPADRS